MKNVDIITMCHHCLFTPKPPVETTLVTGCSSWPVTALITVEHAVEQECHPTIAVNALRTIKFNDGATVPKCWLILTF